jgi:hypothetical protein
MRLLQHYWETKVKNETCHNMRGEAAALQLMIKNGAVRRLLPAPEAAVMSIQEKNGRFRVFSLPGVVRNSKPTHSLPID